MKRKITSNQTEQTPVQRRNNSMSSAFLDDNRVDTIQRQVIQFGNAGSSSGKKGKSKKGKAKKKHHLPQEDDLFGLDIPDNFDIATPFGERLNPDPASIRANDKTQQKGQIAAQNYIDNLSPEELIALQGANLSETALNPAVHDILIEAVKIYGQLQRFPKMYEDLHDKSLFGLSGNCMEVSPIFGYLLNRIYDQKVVSTHRPGGTGGPHTILKTEGEEETYYIDATWRQGGMKPDAPVFADTHNDDHRKALDMVRVSNEKPTMPAVNKAVRDALEEKGELEAFDALY